MRDLSLHILDIVQNSYGAKAKLVEIAMFEDTPGEILHLKISDDGVGMDTDTLLKVCDPFFTTRTTRKVGLGIPLLAETARACGGELKIKSRVGSGTCLEAKFQKNHIDMIPLGSMADTVISLVVSHPEVDLVLSYRAGSTDFCFDTREVKETLEEIPITLPAVLDWVKDFIEKGLEKTYGGA